MYELLDRDWTLLHIEDPDELVSLHCAEPWTGAGTHAGAFVAGGNIHVAGGSHRHTAGDCDCPLAAVEQAGAGRGQRDSDHSQPGAVWLSASGAVVGRPG